MTRQHVKDKLPILEAFASGRALLIDGKRVEDDDVDFNGHPSRFAIAPLTFPDPPAGREWHNPEGFTPEKVGLPEWRLFLTGEKRHDGYEVYSAEDWQKGSKLLIETAGALESDFTYRTRAPLPTPPRRVPLKAADVPVGSVLRFKSWRGGDCWVAILQVTESAGVLIGATAPEWQPWERMAQDFEILRPGQEWTECSKEA